MSPLSLIQIEIMRETWFYEIIKQHLFFSAEPQIPGENANL